MYHLYYDLANFENSVNGCLSQNNLLIHMDETHDIDLAF